MRRAPAIAIWLLAAQAAVAAIDAASGPVLKPALAARGSSDAVASAFSAPRNPLEARLFADAEGGRLRELSPLAAALVASGVETADSLRLYERKAGDLAAALRDALPPTADARQRAEAAFEFLHRRVLYGGYDLACTDLRDLLDRGRFNCISATVLFNNLATECGLDSRGVEMPGHAMSRLMLQDGAFDVETTCPRWFSMSGEERSRPLAAGTAGAVVTIDRTKAREVSPIQMAAMIYYNRGVDLLSQKRFAEAAAANAKAVRLDRTNATARGNLLATLNNWSIDLGNRGQYAEAIGLLRQARAIDAEFPPVAQNFVHVHRQWVDSLCQSGRFSEALSLLKRAAAEMPEQPYLRGAQADIRDRLAKAAAAATNDVAPLAGSQR
ncbi:MAG: tetratricopeptide repeat protein [Thermoguttaceae bacterium]